MMDSDQVKVAEAVKGFLPKYEAAALYAAAIAVLFGLITKNVIVTIFSGLTSYWLIIYIF